MPRGIVQEIIIDQTEDRIFEALITPSIIKKWWSAQRVIVVPETDGLHAVAWGENEDNPEYISAARIHEFKRPVKLLLTDFKYISKEGKLPFKADLRTEFYIESSGKQTKLSVNQTGFPDGPVADDFFAACKKGWENTLSSFKKVVEDRTTWNK